MSLIKANNCTQNGNFLIVKTQHIKLKYNLPCKFIHIFDSLLHITCIKLDDSADNYH